MTGEHQRVYEELADGYHRQGDARQRDVFLTLAADAALACGHVDEADRLRLRLLQFSPHNLLKPYGSFAEALRSRDIQDYLADLRRQYPPEKAVALLGDQAGKMPASHYPPAPPIFKMQESLDAAAAAPPVESTRRGRRPTASPYEVPPYRVPVQSSEHSGNWFALVLFALVLLAGLVLAWWVLVRPVM